MKERNKIDRETLKEHLSYREDGELIWLKNKPGKIKIGDVAGYIKNTDGYRYIKINNGIYLAHRLVFLYHKGYMPSHIDHKNGVRDDNRIDNLRECNDSTNQGNRKISCSSTTNFKGVTPHKASGKYQAQICGKYIGTYITKEEAARAYDKQAVSIFGEFAKLNFP